MARGRIVSAPTLSPAVPILRIFDVQKALDFYVGFLGFHVDWEHRFAPDAPLYMQVSRGDTKLQLSEHHGDAVPGGSVLIDNFDEDGDRCMTAIRPVPQPHPLLGEAPARVARRITTKA